MLIPVLTLFACSGRPPATASEPASPPEPGVRIEASQGIDVDLARTQAFTAARADYERPLRVTGLEKVPGLPDLSAATCAACHTQIHQDWSLSVHAQAWDDPQYQGEIGKSGNRWLCLNCHIPLLTQQDRWPVGLEDNDVERPILVDNPVFDPALRSEGITCAACHVRDGAIAGPGLGGDPPHPVVVDEGLRSGAICIRCHQAEAIFPDKGFVCTFQTGDEWRAGPYDEEGRTCVSCHMPTVERPAALGGPTRQVAQHWWKGSGIPKFAGRYPPAEANVPGLGLATARVGDTLNVIATNAHAGHRLPTGDPERWVQIDVSFVNAAGASVGEPFQHKIMQVWAWEIPPRKVADNRLAPRESRTLPVPVPEGAIAATVVGSSHRISEENAAYHELGDYPTAIETHRIHVPLE